MYNKEKCLYQQIEEGMMKRLRVIFDLNREMGNPSGSTACIKT